MVIHKPTQTRHATPEAARRHYAKYTASLSSIGAGISLDPNDPALAIELAVAGYYTELTPVYDTATHKLGGLVWDDAGYTVAHEIVALTEEEVAAYREQRVLGIAAAVRAYTENTLHPVGMDLTQRLLARTPPSIKAVAVEQWLTAIYLEAERRKALIYAGMEEPGFDDFTAYGDKPFTVAQLMAEL